MAQVQSHQPKGSIVLKLLIVVFLVLMLVSIFTPKAEWEEQNRERDICRLRMENLSYAIREYGVKNLGFVETLGEYIEFTRNDSVEVNAARYEVESLTRDPESGKDSLLVDFTDEFHLSKFEWKTIRTATTAGDSILPDSVHLYAVPHPQFKEVPVGVLILTSQKTINVAKREKNITDHAVLIYSDAQIVYSWVTPEPVLMPSTAALISIPVDDMAECPTSHQPYKLHVNVRSKLEGAVNFTVHQDSSDITILQDTLMFDLLNHRIKTEALAEVLVMVKNDSTLIEKKDSLLVDNFVKKVNAIQTRATYEVTSDHTITVPADSMIHWDNALRIRRSVFVAHVDSLSQVLKAVPEFEEIAHRISYTEEYKVAKIDTVGVTIQCPIDSLYTETDKPFLKKIFGVGTPKNHGSVENGDLSWSEKK